jgi:hypothetical protein
VLDSSGFRFCWPSSHGFAVDWCSSTVVCIFTTSEVCFNKSLHKNGPLRNMSVKFWFLGDRVTVLQICQLSCKNDLYEKMFHIIYQSSILVTHNFTSTSHLSYLQNQLGLLPVIHMKSLKWL